MSQREKRHSEDFAGRLRQLKSTSYTKGEVLPQAHIIQPQESFFYKPTPPPETVVVHSKPKKTKDACCWGCAAALCLCFGLEECCSS